MTPEERRQARLAELASKLQHATGNISLDRTFGWGMLRWGCRQETMQDYLAVLASAGLSVTVHPSLRLRLGGVVGVLLPRPVIRFAGRKVASWGRPLGMGVLTLEVLLP